jgi:hypothetical protein
MMKFRRTELQTARSNPLDDRAQYGIRFFQMADSSLHEFQSLSHMTFKRRMKNEQAAGAHLFKKSVSVELGHPEEADNDCQFFPKPLAGLSGPSHHRVNL